VNVPATQATKTADRKPTMPCFYLKPRKDHSNKIPELQVCIAEALYDVDSIVADPGAYTKEQLATLHSQILSNLERAWEISHLPMLRRKVPDPLYRMIESVYIFRDILR